MSTILFYRLFDTHHTISVHLTIFLCCHRHAAIKGDDAFTAILNLDEQEVISRINRQFDQPFILVLNLLYVSP